MIILAFESSCDETSAAVVARDGEEFVIKSNIIASQVDTHRLYGGVVPEIASRAHIEAISSITYEELERAYAEKRDFRCTASFSSLLFISFFLLLTRSSMSHSIRKRVEKIEVFLI